jgi:hypothetical protein
MLPTLEFGRANKKKVILKTQNRFEKSKLVCKIKIVQIGQQDRNCKKRTTMKSGKERKRENTFQIAVRGCQGVNLADFRVQPTQRTLY